MAIESDTSRPDAQREREKQVCENSGYLTSGDIEFLRRAQ